MRSNRLSIKIFSLSIALLLVYTSLNAQSSSQEGVKYLEKLSEFVFSSKKMEFRSCVTHRGKKYENRGFFIANNQRAFISLEGVSEFQYDKENLYAYSYSTNELTIQKNKGNNNIFDNPFALLQKSNKNLIVGQPLLENLDGKRVTTIVVKPAGKAYYREAKIYMTDSQTNSTLVRIDIWGRSGDKYETTITNISKSNSALMSSYSLDETTHKGAKINDLR